VKNALGFMLAVAVLGGVSLCRGDDWGQFRGPQRCGVSLERGLLRQWPEEGPKLLWSFEGLGKGFASVAVVDAVAYTTGMIDKAGHLFAIDAAGKLLWKTEYGPEWSKTYPGSRTTPTVDGDRIYIMSAHGRMACFERRSGALVWKVDTLEKFESKNVRWGISESVLVHGDKVFCTPGGKNATMVALDKHTGETIWTTEGLSNPSAYCSPVIRRTGDAHLLLTMVEDLFLCVDSATGRVLWTIPHETYNDISAVAPVTDADSVYFTSQLIGGTRVGLFGGREIWANPTLDCLHGGVVLVDGTLFGSDARDRWVCQGWETGEIKFREKILDGKGSVIYAEGRLYCYSEKGTLGLFRPTGDGVEPVSAFKIALGTNEHYAHPALSDGRLYIRHGDTLMVFDIRQK